MSALPADRPVETRADILVVDDTPANLRLLERLLSRAGFQIRPAADGPSALAAATASPPDLILLDVDMPEMNGYEVCRALKAEPLLAAIPVLFLSALGQTEDKLAAFEAGGVDYITKPFHLEELRARISTHLELRQLRKELEWRNAELDERNRRLGELENLRHDLVHMVAHDMRSPLMGVSGYLELLELDQQTLAGEHREFVARALESARALVRQVDAMLDADRLESSRLPLQLGEHDLDDLLERAVATFGPIGTRRIHRRPRADRDARAQCDAELVLRVAANLISNALVYSEESEPVEVEAVPGREGHWRVEVRDRGPGVPEELRDRLFDKYVGKGAARGRTRSMGLGLAFCKLAVEAHRGTIGFDSAPDTGTTFWFELPVLGPVLPVGA